MQKSTAEKFHGFLPASARSERLDAQYVNDEAGTPADSTSAAHCDDRDFGASRFLSGFVQNGRAAAKRSGGKVLTTSRSYESFLSFGAHAVQLFTDSLMVQ
jgi:hypothetical protein